MRIAEPISKPGFFWLPEHDDIKFSGTLRIATSGRVELDLSDLISSNDSRRPSTRLVPHGWPTDEQRQIRPRIHGIVGGQPVTLANCFYRRWDGRLGGGVATATYSSSSAFLGLWHDGPNEPTFTTMTFEVEGLHDWLQFNSLENTTDLSTGLPPSIQHFTYSLPEEVTINVPEGFSLTFGLSASLPGLGPGMTEATFSQQSYVAISAPNPMPMRRFVDLATRLQNFLSLAFDEPLNLLSIRGESPEATVDGRESEIDVYVNTREQANRSSRVAWHRALFSYPELEDRFEEILNGWLSRYRLAEPVFNLYFAVSSDAYRNIEGRFLAIVQAVEGFHRHLLPAVPKLSDTEFKRLKHDAVDAVADEHRPLVHSMLQHANEQSLRERIEAVIEPFGKHFGDEAERKSFARGVAKARNGLSHQTDTLVDPQVRLSHLLAMTNRLEALFQMHFLGLLGLEDSRIDEIVNRHLMHKLDPEVELIG